MRIRYIKPGIMSNEELAELGPYAYILFTGLWMIADREGRFENRPKRIKALVMPLWHEVDAAAVENLVEKLCKTGFLHLYEVNGKQYGEVVNWGKHQRPDRREAKSDLPAPSPAEAVKPVSAAVRADSVITVSSQCNYNVETGGEWGMGNGNGIVGEVKDGGYGGKETAPVENPPKPTTTPAAEQTRKPPAREKSGPRPVNSAPHKPEDVALVRSSLAALAREVRMPAPDDGIVHRLLNLGRGISGEQIHGILVALWKQNKFRSMYSWGFVPLVVSQSLGAA